MKKLAVLSLIFMLSTLYASGKNKDSSQTVFGHEYFNIDTTKQFVFESDFGETISKIETFENGYRLINENDSFIYMQSLLNRPDGLYLENTYQEVDILLIFSKSVEIKYPEPILQMPFPLKKGDKWNWDGYQIQDGDSVEISIDGFVAGLDSVNVPAGNFEALKIQFNIETSKGEKSKISQWLVPNLGRIKLHAEIDDPGLIGVFMDIFGYSEIEFELKEIRKAEI